jgi:membrane protein
MTDDAKDTELVNNKAVQPTRSSSVWLRWWNPVASFLSHDPFTLAASIAFYTALSFAPMLALSLWLAAHLSPGSEAKMLDQLGALLGSQVRSVATVVVKNASPHLFTRSVAGMLSAVTLIVSATTAFAQLQSSINAIWGVASEPRSAVTAWIRQRLLSFGVLAMIGFLLITTLVVSTVLALIFNREGTIWEIANELATLAVFAVSFALLFRYVPDARAPWRYTLVGGAATAVMFEIGKWAIGAYLTATTSADAYGAASSIILLLIWVYYSSLIVLIGAQVTRLLADRFGDGVGLLEYAKPAPQVADVQT